MNTHAIDKDSMPNAYQLGELGVTERLLQDPESLKSVKTRLFDLNRWLEEIESMLGGDGKTSMSGTRIETVAASQQVDSNK